MISFQSGANKDLEFKLAAETVAKEAAQNKLTTKTNECIGKSLKFIYNCRLDIEIENIAGRYRSKTADHSR